MRRLYLTGFVFGTLCLLSAQAQAQFTTQSGKSRTPSQAVRPSMPSAPTFRPSQTPTATAQDSAQNAPASAAASGAAAAPAQEKQKVKSWGVDEVEIPDFTVTIDKDFKNMPTEQKVLLLEEYARKQQAEAKAKAAAAQAEKDALAKKLATETPKPGFVFDEQGNEVVIPKGEFWVYSTGYEQKELYGRISCSWKAVLQNRTDAVLSTATVAMTWPNHTMEVTFSDVPAGGNKVEAMAMYSQNCPTLRSKPRLEVRDCTLGPMKADKCAAYMVSK